jgi:hypothetical protein
MRSIAQPGAPVTERIQWVTARGRAFSFVLEAGIPLLEAVRRGFAAEGFSAGVLSAKAGALGPFAYVFCGRCRWTAPTPRSTATRFVPRV